MNPVTVLVLDTGAPEGESGVSFVGGNPDPRDRNGHATAVASVIRERAPEARLVFSKAVPESGHGSPCDLANALFAAADERPDIVNVSLAVPRGEPRLHRAVKTLRAAGALIVCGAGNDPAKGIQWPARYPETISVGALGRDGRPASFSPDGCDLMLPGERVPVGVPGRGRAPMSGTSVACAVASGLLAAAIAAGGGDALEQIRRYSQPQERTTKMDLKSKLAKLIDKWLKKLFGKLPAETARPASAPEPTPEPTNNPDEVDYDALDWRWGGFDGSGAALSSARIAGLAVTHNGLSYKWTAGGCEDLDRACSHGKPCCTCALFCRVGGKWVGGKFDHISTDRRTRDFANIRESYGGWDPSALSRADAFAFVILDDGARRRTNVIVQEGGVR